MLFLRAWPGFSVLGFGAMRLPVLPDGHVNETEATRMIRYAIDHGVSIPECFELYNQAHMYDAKESVQQIYTMFLGGVFDGVPTFASCCQDCGECEEKCPQGLPIRENLRKVSEFFGR